MGDRMTDLVKISERLNKIEQIVETLSAVADHILETAENLERLVDGTKED